MLEYESMGIKSIDVSIIIPAYNEENCIAVCVNSLKPLLRSGDEIIVVDNNSDDKTAQIAKKLGVKVVLEKKRGISNARNKGAEVATNEVLCFIDADSTVSRSWLASVRKAFKKDPEIYAVTGLNIYSHSNLFKMIWYNLYTFCIYLSLLGVRLTKKEWFLAGNNMAIKRDVFKALNGFDPYIAEDYWFSQKFWAKYSHHIAFSPTMTVYCSSRGFDASGFRKTLLLWLKSTQNKLSQANYSYRNKDL